MKQTEIFQMLGDATRLRALALLDANDELCVCELVEALDLSQPKMSRHLTALKNAGLVTSRRDAQWAFYVIIPKLEDWQSQAISWAMVGIAKETEVAQDARRLAQMKDRPVLA